MTSRRSASSKRNFFFSSRRRHTRWNCDWSSDVCYSDLADEARIPGGSALAVDRVVFSRGVEARVLAHPNVTLVRAEVTELVSPAVIATGPLTSDALADAIAARPGVQPLAFFDSIAPIVSAGSTV